MSKRIQKYLSDLKQQSEATARTYSFYLKDFDSFNKGGTDELISSLLKGKKNPYDVLNGFVAYLQEKGTLDPRSVRNRVKVAKNLLVINDVDISDVKFRLKVRMPKPVQKVKEGLSKSDIVAVINGCADIRLKTFVMFLASTGCRAEESLAIRLENIDFGKDPVVVHIDGRFTKTKRDRDVWLTGEMKKQLELWLAYKYEPSEIKSKGPDGKWKVRHVRPQRSPRDLVFEPYKEKRDPGRNIHTALRSNYYTLYDRFAEVVKRVGLDSRKVTFHRLRDFVYTAIDSLGQNQFAEFYLGHAHSTYWAKPYQEKITTFRAVEPYLTFVDVGQLEATTQDLQARLKAKDSEILEIRVRQADQARRTRRLERLLDKKTVALVESTADTQDLTGEFGTPARTQDIEEDIDDES